MGRRKTQVSGMDKLRVSAEEKLSRIHAIPENMTQAEAEKLLHELQVHQVELEMQNEELRKAQAVIEESRSRYANLYDFSPVGYMTIDRKGRILEANLTAASMLGVERGTLINSFFQRFIISENRDAFLRHIAGSIDDSTRFNFEVMLRNKKDQELFFLLDGILVEGLKGQASFMVSISDITARKVADMALQRTQDEQLQSIMDNSPVVIYVKDLNGRYLFVNKKYQTLLHLKKEGIVGKTDHDILPKEMADTYRANDIKVIKSNKHIEFEEVAALDGKQHAYFSIKFPLYNVSGDIEAICGISTDITERKHLEQEQIKSQKLESLGLLAGGIAHDYNNLLTGIIGNLSLLEDDVDKGIFTKERLIQVEKAALRAQELTQQLLTFSKGGAPVKKTTSVGLLINESVSLTLRGSNVLCEQFFPEDLWLVDADEGQIVQVISNLLINALQAMPDGGKLRIGAENSTITENNDLLPAEGRYVKILIEDEGIGIPDKILSKIFDPYFSTKQKGSGLGLASSFSIVKKHGGYFDVSSKVGLGTTFTIYLPASDEKAVLEECVRSELPASAGGRILVMDDEEIIRDVTTAILTSMGYEVTTSKDGSEAIRLYKEARERGEPFNAVIMDLTIPGGIGGNEAIISLLDYDPDARVIVSSGYSNDPVMADFKKYGFSAVVTKPYKATELGTKLYQVITGKN